MQYFTLWIAGEYFAFPEAVFMMLQLLVTTSSSRALIRRLLQCASDLRFFTWNHPGEDADLELFRPLFGKSKIFLS